jgi:uncharacterized protein (TIGR03067 family)
VRSWLTARPPLLRWSCGGATPRLLARFPGNRANSLVSQIVNSFSSEVKATRRQGVLNRSTKEIPMRTLAPASVVSLLILAAAQAGNQDALKKELDLLRGTWSVHVPLGDDEVKGQFAIYGEESFEINFGGNHVNGVRKIDPAKNPKEITLTPDGANKSLFGIYKLEGDTLTLCFGEKRPSDFKAKEGTTLWVLKREKRDDK